MIPDKRFRQLALDQWHREGEIEIDEDAAVSRGENEVTGAYVQAWVWVEVESEEKS